MPLITFRPTVTICPGVVIFGVNVNVQARGGCEGSTVTVAVHTAGFVPHCPRTVSVYVVVVDGEIVVELDR